MMNHLDEIVNYMTADSESRIVGPFIQEQISRSGERDVHFALVWLMNWLAWNAKNGYRGAEKLPVGAPFVAALGDLVSRSDELSRLFVASADAIDYVPELPEKSRRGIEQLVPADWGRDADV